MSSSLPRVLLVLVDGLGDVAISAPHPTHQDKGSKDASTGLTPLQSTPTPNLDSLTKRGVCGLMDPVRPGLACGSDTAHLSLLGYPPFRYYRGRGAFESMGAGLDMQEGDVAFKSNFAVLSDDGTTVRLRRADRAFHSWGVELCPFLTSSCRLPSFPDVVVSIRYATEHRCAVVLRGPDLSDCITGTDPLVDGRPLARCKPTVPVTHSEYSAAERTSRVVNELSDVVSHLLSSHPLILERQRLGLPTTNVVLLRGAGKRIHVPPFTWPPSSAETAHPKAGFVLAPTAIIGGLGMSLSMQRLECEGATGDYRTDLNKKAEAAARNIRESEHAFGMLHVKAVDDAGHDRSVARKTEWIGRVDAMVGRLVQLLTSGSTQPYVVVVTADHSTPVLYGDHAHEPVPVVIAAVGGTDPVDTSSRSHLSDLLRADSGVEVFDEVSCSRGILGRFSGSELMPTVERFCRLLDEHNS